MNLTHVAEGHQDEDVMQFFEENGELYETRLKSIVSRLNPFEVRLTHLQANTGAIVLRGQDQGQIATIRDELMDLPRLRGRIIDAGFIHSTQARYKKQAAISEVRERLGDIEVNIPVMIDKIGLVRAEISFSKPHVILEEFEL